VSIGTRDGMAHGAPGMQEMPRYFRALQLQRSISRMSLDAAGKDPRDLDPSGLEVDDEKHEIPNQAGPCDHLHAKEVSCRDCSPVSS